MICTLMQIGRIRNFEKMKMKHPLGKVTVAALGLASLPRCSGQEDPRLGNIYGQLNFGVLSVDDGVDTNTTLNRNDNYSQQPRRPDHDSSAAKRL